MRKALIVMTLIVTSMSVCGQDSLSLYNKVFNLPDKLFDAIHKKSDKFQQRVLKSTNKYINKLERQEMKMKRKLAKTDSAKAEEVFGNIKTKYTQIKSGDSLNENSGLSIYSPQIDSMQTALRFLQSSKIIAKDGVHCEQCNQFLQQYGLIRSQLNKQEFIKKQIADRRQFLEKFSEQYDFGNSFKKYQQNIYYYRRQIEEYKSIVEDPSKLEATLLKVVTKVPAFVKFFNKHSELASLFRLPGNSDGLELPGLQSRAMLAQELQQRFGSGANLSQSMSNTLSSVESELGKAKDKLSALGSGNEDLEMPDFKPNDQKTKSFLKRLELGANVQSVKSNQFFPITSDLALTLAYKINSRSAVGIGASYKMGWGQDIKHISISHQGVGLRSFAELKLKGSIWLSGGSELNYRQTFESVTELRDQLKWQTSILAGFSKKYSISKKFKGSVQILYDFLYKQSPPGNNPLIIRAGYQFNSFK